jgi:CheY-like chemotaxis protein
MSKKLILLVEDNPDDEALTLRSIRRAGFSGDVVVARDGVEALDYLRSSVGAGGDEVPGRPDLVMLDLKMPRIGGLELLRLMRSDAALLGLPVVVFTSSNEECDIQESYRLGANSYIRKPVEFVRLSETIHHLLVYWLDLNISPVGFIPRLNGA